MDCAPGRETLQTMTAERVLAALESGAMIAESACSELFIPNDSATSSCALSSAWYCACVLGVASRRRLPAGRLGDGERTEQCREPHHGPILHHGHMTTEPLPVH